MPWTILETQPTSAEANMQFDAHLLEHLGAQENPILHLYEWERPSVTFGYFIKPETLLNLESAQKHGLDLARRPTGGGVVFHLWDLAFSVLIPAKSPLFTTRTLDNYNLVNQIIKNAVAEMNGNQEMELIPEDATYQDPDCTRFCMARPTKYDVVLNGKKIAGAAQRKTKDGFLHQGSIALVMPEMELLTAILPSEAVRMAMEQNSMPLARNLQEGRKQMCELLKKHFVRL